MCVNMTRERDTIGQIRARTEKYHVRERDTIGQIRARTEKYKSSFYPHFLSKWNKLDPEIRLSSSVAVFKTKIPSKIRPPTKSVFVIHDPKGLSHLTQLRVVSAS